MISRSRVPWSLRGYALLIVIGVIFVIIEAHGTIVGLALFAGIVAVWLKFLLGGSRRVWLATLVVSILGLALDLILGTFTYLGLVGGIIGVVLLLLPMSQEYFRASNRVDS